MNKISCFLAFLLLSSCNDFNVKKTSSETILNEELKTFNWNEVDQYPSFSSCDSFLNKEEKKECFQSTLTRHIYQKLQQEQLIVTQNINDTVIIKFLISESGKLELLTIKVDAITTQEIPQIKDIITNSISDLPEIHPAIKRGQQVKTEFKLPLIIKVE